MPFLQWWQRKSSRPRRAFNPLNSTIQTLEIRSLLSSAAVIQWSMVPQIAPDPLHGNEPDLPNTFAYVNPPKGYPVTLDASHSVGIQRTTTFSWTVTNSVGRSTHLTGEDPRIDLLQGSYQVKLTATGLRNTKKPLSATTQVQVKDVLIVSIGDSYASGEGNPVVPGVLFPQWAYSPNGAMNTENADAHRSTIAGPAQFALELQEANPHEAVTFVSVADSGASIPVGVLGPMASIGDSSVQLPAQISELKQIIGTRHIDVLTVSVGADDIHFSTLAEDLIENTEFGVLGPSLNSILQQFNTDLSQLPSHFAALAQAISGLKPSQVLLTPYPDLTHDQNGNVAALLSPLGVPLVSLADAQFASSQLIAPLDAVITTAAREYKWTLVTNIVTDFNTHGYPSTSRWIRTLGESLAMQGNQDGTFHPNALGNLDIAKNLLAAYRANLG
ncbi:MAG: hypothetical protein ACLQIB_46785 [Isosphaeraceae bacterium]